MKQENKTQHSSFNDWQNEDVWDPGVQTYDDIVDDSDFKPTAEKIRDNQFNSAGSVTDPSTLPYDYPANKPITELVDDVSLALRNGKLDKADIQRLNELVSNKLVSDNKSHAAKEALKEAEKATKNREKALDNLLDVNQESK